MKLELAGVSRAYGSHRALDHVDYRCDGVGALVLIGPSGGGKSTLLRILAGLERPDAGSVEVDGVHLRSEESALRAHRRTLGVVFQAFNLFPHLSALRNITLPLEEVHGFTRAEAESRAKEVLGRFRLEAHAAKTPGQLSGGQRQRAAIARAIAARPRLLLFDEPTSALDPEMTAEVLEVIRELREEGRDLVLVTHEMGFARVVADEVVFLADGRVVEHASPGELFARPRSPLVADFLGRILRYEH